LLPLLGDDDAGIAARAAALAGRLGRKAAVPKLLRLLTATDESLRNTALAVLVELLPAERLDELAGASPGSDPLRRVHTRLGERIGLDTGLRLVAAIRDMTPTTAWLLNRLATGFGPFAWTDERVAMLMRACADRGGAQPDYAALAAVVARHPQAAADAVRPHRIVVEGQAEWAGPRIALRVLLRLPAGMLDGLELPEGLPAALERERQLEAEEAARATAHFRRQQALEAAIDADGSGVDLDELLGLADLRRLDEARRRVLALAVARHLPDGGHWDPEDPGLITAAHVGVEIAMPLAPGTWRRLLDAHLRAPYRFDLGDDRIAWWLATTRPADAHAELARRIAEAEHGRAVGTLLAIAGGDADDACSARRARGSRSSGPPPASGRPRPASSRGATRSARARCSRRPTTPGAGACWASSRAPATTTPGRPCCATSPARSARAGGSSSTRGSSRPPIRVCSRRTWSSLSPQLMRARRTCCAAPSAP